MSKVQICNRALSTYLGIGRINSLTEASPAAEQCNLHYDDTLEAVLESHWWGFATGRQSLALEVNDRSSEWAYRYAIPTYAMMIRWVNDPATAKILLDQGQSPDAPRAMSGTSIYCNVALASCEFTKPVTDATLYPRYFADALSAALAANMAMALTEDVKRAQNAMQQAGQRLDDAIAKDESQQPTRQYQTLPAWYSDRGLS